MSTLNIINKSPFEKRSLEQSLLRLGAGDSVLLIEDASVAAVDGNAWADQLLDAAKTIQLYVLQPDLDARGFSGSSLVAGFKTVDYSGFVELVTGHDRVHSWL